MLNGQMKFDPMGVGSKFPTQRRFVLVRDEDVTGVSGTGIVVQGCQFADGACAIRWVSETASTTHHDSIENVIKVHGHNGATRLVWVD